MDPLTPEEQKRRERDWDAQYATPEQVLDLMDRLDVAEDHLEKANSLLTAIQASLGEVAVYEGMGIGRGSLVLYVNELVRDHEELERRIDLALMTTRDESIALTEVPARIALILRGSVPTPDSPGGLDG